MTVVNFPGRVDVDELLNSLAVEAALRFGGENAHPEFVRLFLRAFQRRRVEIVTAIHAGLMEEILSQ